MTTVSVLIPCHRAPMMLLESVASVLDQTHQALELLVGLHEGDPEYAAVRRVVEMCCAVDSRVRMVVCDGDRRFANRYRQLFAAAQNPWCATLDYDDLWLPQKLALQLPYAGEFDVIGTGGSYFGTKTDRINVPTGTYNHLAFRQGNPVPYSSALLRRADGMLLDDAYTDWGCDYKLWVDLWNAGRRFYNLPEPLLLHRLHLASTANVQDRPDIRNRIAATVRVIV